MKQLIKYFIFSLFLMLILPACSPSHLGKEIDGIKTQDDLDKLHHIHPTKPIKIPDTITIIAKPAILDIPIDTTMNKE